MENPPSPVSDAIFDGRRPVIDSERLFGSWSHGICSISSSEVLNNVKGDSRWNLSALERKLRVRPGALENTSCPPLKSAFLPLFFVFLFNVFAFGVVPA